MGEVGRSFLILLILLVNYRVVESPEVTAHDLDIRSILSYTGFTW